MSDADQNIKTLAKRICEEVQSKKKSHTIPKSGDKKLAGMQTRAFSVTGKIGSEQVDAIEGDYIVEVRVRARRWSDNSYDPSSAGFRGLLDDQVKRHLQAIADLYPQAPEAKRAPTEGAARSTDLLQLLRTLG